jgi:hypothetical protein
MTDWILAHQPFLISIIAIHGASIAVLVAALLYQPRTKE